MIDESLWEAGRRKSAGLPAHKGAAQAEKLTRGDRMRLLVTHGSEVRILKIVTTKIILDTLGSYLREKSYDDRYLRRFKVPCETTLPPIPFFQTTSDRNNHEGRP